MFGQLHVQHLEIMRWQRFVEPILLNRLTAMRTHEVMLLFRFYTLGDRLMSRLPALAIMAFNGIELIGILGIPLTKQRSLLK